MQHAPWACLPEQTRGRRHAEAPAAERSEFGRDRDRIVHCSAFRRLEYKTQVFVNHEGDLFRTRLTHSIEVAQIARSIARALGADEDLTEAIALAHDLGHTPFGHAGQDALNACMQPHGGFEHNLQSLRVVDQLEERYGGFDGLNLTFETREGILKHCSRANAETLGDVGLRFIDNKRPSIEAQIANLADEIAYNNHDVDDGSRSGLLTMEQLRDVPLFAEHEARALAEFPSIAGRRLIHETVRRMINTLILDLIKQTRLLLKEHAPANLEAVRNAPPLVAFSEPIREQSKALKHFLYQQLYRHYRVMRMSEKAKRTITDLFNAFIGEPRLLPTQYQQQAETSRDLPRTIADYIAGMTDRYAIREHQRVFDVGQV